MEAKLEKLSAYATTMAQLYLSAAEKVPIFEGLVGEELCGRLVDSYGAHAHVALIRSLVSDLIRDIWAFTLDRDSRAPSVTNLWSELSGAEVRDAFRVRFCNSTQPEGARPEIPAAERERYAAKARAAHSEKAGEAFDEVFRRLDVAVPEFLGTPRAQRLGDARKRAIAHYNMTKPEGRAHQLFNIATLGLGWEDLRCFLSDAESIILELARLMTGTEYAVDEFHRIHQLHAADFWSRVMGKGPVNEQEFGFSAVEGPDHPQ